MPYIAIEPIKHLLNKPFIARTYANADYNTHDIANTILSSDLEVTIMLKANGFMLSEAMEIGVGKTVLFDKEEQDLWTMAIGDIEIGQCKIGKVGDNIAVTVDMDSIIVKNPNEYN